MTSFNLKTTISTALWATCLTSLVACGSRREKAPEELIEGAPFRVESFNAKDVQVSKTDSLGLPAAKTYTFMACVQDSVMRAPIVYTPFEVSDGETTKAVRSDNNGCLLWDEVHPVDSLQNESLLKITRTIIGKDAVQGSVKMELAFNPLANDPSAIQDLRKFTPVYKMTEAKSFSFNTESNAMFAADISKRAIINLAGLSLGQSKVNSSQYRVNKLLEMQWARDYQISLSPTAIRKKLDGSDDTVGLTKGKYRVQFLIVKENSTAPYKASDVITGFDHVVEVSPYPVPQIVTLPLKDPSLVSSRTKALVKISVIGDLESKVKTGFYVATVAPMRGGDTDVKFQVARENVETTFEKMAAGELLPSMSTNASGLSLFAKNSGFIGTDVENVDRSAAGITGKGPYDFSQAVAGYLNGDFNQNSLEFQMLQKVLCYKTFKSAIDSSSSWPNMKTACTYWPTKVMQMAVREFVTEVTNPVPKLVGIPLDYTLAVSNSYSYSKGDQVTKSWDISGKFDLSLGASIPGISALQEILPISFGEGLSGGISAGISKSESSSIGTSKSASVSTGQTLNASAETYEIGVEVKKCLLFSANSDYQDKMLAGSKSKFNGYFVCNKKTETKLAEETYYLIDQPVASTITRDGDAASASRWRMKIRGTNKFNLFNSIISNPNIVLNFQKFSEDPKLDQLASPFKVFQDYPGMLSQE